MMRRILLPALAPVLMIAAALAPAAALGVHATATAATPGPTGVKTKKACFYSDDVRSWRWVDDRTVNIQAGGKHVFRLTLFSNCPDLRTAETIGVKTAMGQGFVCDGLDIDIITPSPVGPRTCAVTQMRELTPQEVAALPKNQQP